ncbi:MAG: Gfo/Idh/MocA family oxidoreductase [Verrucomicrobia bacterium]|nr:Gfo/Idh/MocA family oxidoreductase [Verrucomicrobiota bacterium]MBV8486593.1 Gfo/Idh/MocA family oxidoreductase [Verrucomicrobiota bacterium]
MVLTASVIGCGVGGRLSLEALTASPLFQLVAAADVRFEVHKSLQQDFPGLQTFSSHQEMFAQCPTDVVCVSTYAPSHESIVLDALAVPSLRGILVEKPLGDTAVAGRQIIEAIKARKLPMVVPHGLRTRATSLEVIDRVLHSEIGELRSIEVQCDKWDLLNAGIHWLDFCLAATGEAPIASVLAACDTSTRTYRDGMQVETVAVTYVENVNGVRMILQTGDFLRVNTPGKQILFRLLGTGGIIEFWAWENGYSILNAQYPAGQIIVPDEFPVFGHRRHLETLAEQIRSGTPAYRLPESSLTALEICEAAFLSWQHRCQVRFPLASFVPPAPSDWHPGKPYFGAGGGRDGRKLGQQF